MQQYCGPESVKYAETYADYISRSMDHTQIGDAV